MLRSTSRLASLCLILALVAACGQKRTDLAPPPPVIPTAPAAPPKPGPPPTPGGPAVSPRPLTDEELFAKKSLEELSKELADVFFDLDRSTIRDDGKGPLTTNAEWLKRWSTTRITIEGHCDERGTPEYNLGLGERRATAVKDYLVGLGIAADRIAVVSKGKEAPVCTDKNEACWQQNRRGHFIVTAK